jgi:hypothetical protein
VLLGGLAAAGCSDAFGVDDVLGVWESTSINGYDVPGTVTMNSSDFDVEYYRITFQDGGECAWAARIDGETYGELCEYTVNANQETIRIEEWQDSDGWYAQGPVDGDRMTVTFESGEVMVLEKT